MKTTGMKQRAWIMKGFFTILISMVSFFVFAQDPTDSLPGDPGAFSVYTVQNLSFGAFTPGSSGGTIIIATSGSRTVTGNVIPLNFGIIFCQAIFEIDAPSGSILSILNGPSVNLTGSNGGLMSLTIGASDPVSPFTVTVPSPGHTSVSVAGTLTVGNMIANPPGSYTGNFYITFNQE